jgi:hypothetical protein
MQSLNTIQRFFKQTLYIINTLTWKLTVYELQIIMIDAVKVVMKY